MSKYGTIKEVMDGATLHLLNLLDKVDALKAELETVKGERDMLQERLQKLLEEKSK